MANRTIGIDHVPMAGDEAPDDGVLLDAVSVEASAPEDAPHGALPVWLFARGEAPRRIEVGPAELRDLAADDDNFVWIDLDGYGSGDLRALAEAVGAPERAVNIALGRWQRPRFEVFGDRSFVTVTVPRLEPADYRVLAAELDLFVGRNALLSAHKHPVPFAENVVARAQQDPDLLRRDSAFLLSILLDEVLGYYERVTEDLEDEVEEMEERALTDASDAFLGDLLALKRYVFAVYRLADQHRPVFAALLRPDVPFAGGDDVLPYFRDLNERLTGALGALAGVKDGVNGAFDIYVSQVAHHTNGTMKLLTIVSATLLPASVILGFFGTQFQTPDLLSPTGFVIMILAIVLTTAAVLVYFHRRGWLGPAPAPVLGSRAARRRSGESGGAAVGMTDVGGPRPAVPGDRPGSPPAAPPMA